MAVGLYRIGDGYKTYKLSVEHKEHRCFALCRQIVGCRLDIVANRCVLCGKGKISAYYTFAVYNAF